MATAELVVAFSAKLEGLEASLKRVTSKLEDMEGSAGRSRKSMEDSASAMEKAWGGASASIKAFIAAYAGIQSLRGLAELAVTVDQFNASIRRMQVIMSATQGTAQETFRGIAEIAERTGQPVQELAQQFNRFYIATRDIGASAADVEKLMNVLAGFSQLSGQKPQEAAAAITQLAQGLASGKLQGDELKSIMENMPQLAQALAQSLGVSVGQLRQLGEEGKLTTDRVFPALIKAGKDLEKQLEDLPKTLTQAWQALKDRGIETIATLDRRIGATEWLSKWLAIATKGVREFNEQLEGTGAAASPTNAINNLAREAAAAEEKVRGLRQELARAQQQEAGVMGRLGQAAGLTRIPDIQRRLMAAENELTDNLTRQAELRARVAVDGWNQQGQAARDGLAGQAAASERTFREIIDAGNPVLAARRKFQEDLTRIDEAYAAARRAALINGDGVAAALADTRRREAIESARKQLADAEYAAGADARQAANEAEQARKKAEREAEQARNLQNRQVEEIVRAAGNQLSTLKRQFSEWSTRSGDQAVSTFDAFIGRIKGGTEEVGTLMGAVRRETVSAAEAMVRMGQDPAPALEELKRVLETLREPLIAATGNAKAVDDAIANTVASATSAVTKMTTKVDNSFRDIEKSIAQSFSRDLAGTLVDFATGAETSFAKVAADFSKMVAKMILNWMIFKAVTYGLKEFLGIDLSNGSNTPPLTPPAGGQPRVNPFATGVPDGATPAMARAGGFESSPYFSGSAPLFSPSVTGGRGEITVNVINQASNTTTRQQERSNGLGGREIDIYIEEVVRRGMVSGAFDTTMSSAFGASRIGRV